MIAVPCSTSTSLPLIDSLTILGGCGAGVAWRRAADVDRGAAFSTEAARPEDSRARGIDVVALNEQSIVTMALGGWKAVCRTALLSSPVFFRPISVGALV